MSAAKKKNDNTYELTGPWAGAWKIFAAAGAFGVVASAVGAMSNPRRFAFSWLFAFVTVLCVGLGSLFFVLYQRLTSAGWSVTVRRTAEFFASGLVVFAPLFIPVVVYMGHLFPWLGESHAAEGAGSGHASIAFIPEAHAQSPADHAAPANHAAPPGAGFGKPPSMRGRPPSTAAGHHGGPSTDRAHDNHRAHELIEKNILEKKSAYLNKNFFLARAFLYFAIWTFLAFRLFGYSTKQDTEKGAKLTLDAQGFSAPGIFLFGLSLTFASFDWIMSLEPLWFSTIFGVNIFACAVVSSHAAIILVTMALKNSGPLKDAVTVEHFHDLGKLMFGFLVFWAYISFSQLMLIWYAALPEETTFFHNRWDYEPWAAVSMALILLHFAVPFFWLISRNFKRNLGRLQIGAAWLLTVHMLDMYWFIMPNFMLGKTGFTFHWLDVTCLLAVAGAYGAFVFFRMTKYPLIPIGDPRLQRSLHFQNA